VAFLLGCENVHIEYPSKKIFDSVSLGIDEGDRIGILGANGDGKSSLLALLAGLREPDYGRIIRRTGTTVHMLGQTDTVEAAETVARSVVGDAPEYVWASDARIRSIIEGLLDDIPWNGRVGALSGGQRRRVDLARVLVEDSDVLMLDEPTNHLDVRAIAWLATHLKERWPKRAGALLVVTHDRWFLDEVCLGMWEVHDGRVDAFEGGYSAYVLQRLEREEAARIAGRKRRNIMRRELAWLARGPQARSTKPKFRVDAARTLIADEPPMRDSLELKQTAMSRLGKQVVDLLRVTAAPGDSKVLDDVTWHIGPGDRLGVLGENGAGKTTLLDIVRGARQPDAGEVRIGQTVRFAVLSQHLDELAEHDADRVRELLARYKTRYEIDGRDLTPAQLLERLGFEQAHLSVRIGDLSGGQRRRLQLMLVLLDRPNVLILDEPDNDLDTDMLAVVEGLLDSWPGTLLLVTHDRYLMERVTDDQYALMDGKVVHIPGGVGQYLEVLAERRQTRADASSTERGVRRDAAPGPQRPAARSGADGFALRKELASTERKLRTLEAKAEGVRLELYDADLSDYVALGEIQQRIHEADAQIAELEERWLEISQQLE